MKQILFVCTGNTCRSPMAEALFRAHDGQARTGCRASSAGLFVHEGLPASDYAVQAVQTLGGDLHTHRARPLTEELVEAADYIVCMTAAHLDRLCERFPQAVDKTYTLAPQDVADPFGGDLNTYRAAAAQIDQAVQTLIAYLESGV